MSSGPGSLYTSILAPLVVPGVAEAVAAARAARLFVCNLMTEPGETDGYGVAAHLQALAAHGLSPAALDYVIVNTRPVCLETRAGQPHGAEPVRIDFASCAGPPRLVPVDVLDAEPAIRH